MALNIYSVSRSASACARIGKNIVNTEIVMVGCCVSQSQAELSDTEALLRFIQFIPLEDEILDFFRPVAPHIMQKLRAKPCLPTQSMNCIDDNASAGADAGNDSDSTVVYKRVLLHFIHFPVPNQTPGIKDVSMMMTLNPSH